MNEFRITSRAYLKFAERQRSKCGRSAEGTKPDTLCCPSALAPKRS
ncbi:MAG: hypothetical protein KAV25_03740 [Methanophagales archaeon]|nr:hypothetical protein [Methanophagales archaeon]